MCNPKLTCIFIIILAFAFHQQSFSQLYRWKKKVNGAGLGNPLTVNPRNHHTLYGAVGGGIIVVSYDKGASWSPFDTIQGGSFIKSIAVSPLDSMTMLVGQEVDPFDRILKTTDGGISWSQTLFGDFSYYGVPIEFNPAHPDTVFTMMGEVVYRSTDFGSTWNVINADPGFNAWCDAALRPDSVDVMYVGDNTSGIWKTTDGGISFRKVFITNGEIPMIAIDQVHPAIAYATKWSGGGGLLKTTDYGETWQEISAFSGHDTWGVSVGLDDPNLIVMGTYSFSGKAGIHVSRDGGTTWEKISQGLSSSSLLNYGILAIDTSAITSLQSTGIFQLQSSRTIVAGSIMSNDTHEAVTNGYLIKQGSLDTIYLSKTNGTYALAYFADDSLNIKVQAFPYIVHSEHLSFIPDSTVKYDIALIRLGQSSIAGTITDSTGLIPLKATVRLLFSDFEKGSQSFTLTTDIEGKFLFDKLYISQSPVVSSYRLEIEPELPFAQYSIAPFALDSVRRQIEMHIDVADVFLVGEDSAQYGKTFYLPILDTLGLQHYFWNTVEKGEPPFPRAKEFRKNLLILFTATKQSPLTNESEKQLRRYLDNGGNLFASGYSIVAENDSTPLIRDYFGLQYGGSSSTGLVRGAAGDPYFSRFTFATIIPNVGYPELRAVINLTNLHVHEILRYGSSGLFGTAGIRIDSIGSSKTSRAVVTGFGFEMLNGTSSRKNFLRQIIQYLERVDPPVSVIESGRMPEDFVLFQNYPNPFNPSTTIRYTLPVHAFVRMTVYDDIGREIDVVDVGEKGPGTYSVTWDARNFPSGMYFYRINTARQSLSGKMLLVK